MNDFKQHFTSDTFFIAANLNPVPNLVDSLRARVWTHPQPVAAHALVDHFFKITDARKPESQTQIATKLQQLLLRGAELFHPPRACATGVGTRSTDKEII